MQKDKGEGIVKVCCLCNYTRKYITSTISVWDHAAVREYDIGTRIGLRLVKRFNVYLCLSL